MEACEWPGSNSLARSAKQIESVSPLRAPSLGIFCISRSPTSTSLAFTRKTALE